MKEKNDAQSSYRKLFSNTIIFAIGSFSSKILVFLLLPLYTTALSREQFGSADLIAQMANFILPIATLSITESIIRFGLDKKYSKSSVFTTGIIVTLAGMLFVTLVMPFISMTSYVKGYAIFLYIYVFTASIKLIFCEFVRSKGLVKLYAFNGILTTLSMLIFNILFLLILKIGIAGYLLAIILSDFISAVFIFWIAQLYKYFSLKAFSKVITKQMLAFSIPLIPATIMWWITNVSDRFFVNGFMGDEANGLYAIAYKIPTIIITIFAMFNQAWNMSAITEYNSKQKEKFYSNVFSSNQSVIYVIAAGVMLFLIPLTKILVSDKFFIAYKYTPVLIVATVFTCFTSFLGSIYAATKKTKHSLVTSMIGALLNIGLNIILIPLIGINGASIATLISYMVVFLIRIIDIRRFLDIKAEYGKMLLNTFLLALMALSILFVGKYMAIPLIILFLTILLINLSVILKSLRAVLPQRVLNRFPFLKARKEV